MSDVAHYFDAWFRLTDAESLACQDLLIAFGMQFSESHTKFKLVAVNIYCAVCLLLSLHGILRQTVGIDAEEISHPCLFQFEVASHTVEAHHMHDISLHRSEHPLQHVVEVYTDVSGYTSTLVHIALPRCIIPLTSRSDISEVNIIHFVLRSFIHLFLQCHD